jgi:hypothetical protein
MRRRALYSKNTISIDSSSIISYYKMEDNTIDSIGGNDGVFTNPSYTNGLVNRTAVFAGASQSGYITIPNAQNLSFGDGTTDQPFSFRFSYYRNGSASSTGTWFLNKRENTSNKQEFQFYEYQGDLRFELYSGSNSSNGIKIHIDTPFPSVGQWYHLTCTYDGSGLTSGLKMYLDDNLLNTIETTTGTYTAMSNTGSEMMIGRAGWNAVTNTYINGHIDELAFFNKELTIDEVIANNATVNSGQSLI